MRADLLRMPRFFLHIADGDSVTRDIEGAEFLDIDAARDEANASAVDLVVEHLRSGLGLGLHRSIRITDETGTILEEVLFANAIVPVPRT